MITSRTLDSSLHTAQQTQVLLWYPFILCSFSLPFSASDSSFSLNLQEISCNNRIKLYLTFLCAYRSQMLGGTAENIILSGTFNRHKKKWQQLYLKCGHCTSNNYISWLFLLGKRNAIIKVVSTGWDFQKCQAYTIGTRFLEGFSPGIEISGQMSKEL